MNYQWYPGHMTKARRQMQEDLKLIDLMIELVDARVPAASRNPDIDELGKNKARLILLNKSDLADERGNDAWMEYFKGKGYSVVKVNSRSGAGMKAINSAVQEACKEKIERDRKQLELLDTPGILWPKFEDQQVGLHLAMIGSINDEILNVEELALSVIDYLTAEYPGTLEKRFGFEGMTDRVEILGEIARVRGCLKKGNELDYEKAARLLMDDFRSGKLGRITLEKPE